MLRSVRFRKLLRSQRTAVLRAALSRAARFALRVLPEADHGQVHHGDVPQVPSRAFRVRILSPAVEQGYVQRTEQ